ncbi:NUDIX hydrolase [Methylacidiphilum caldifontis]|uniref:NUDIX hydrolase n=1 Tax=Methylacidiphilum caldifontis TaxID=2795386 RepID=A0A4Y8PDE4_9BACT|nr:NUDIX domain-containing protein [Methylacidiphilum caldifontis]QSR88009.1 NUDIX domain-containing protein [Methylacidiphilum caldifontis]TFE69547.1 NUDIX hydrolase [Methylacidiphilum caldifontis]
MEEYFDVVDDKDKVIGKETRKNVHLKNLKHRAVHILLENQNKEVFLQRRSPLKDINPSCWDSSCSGHVLSGEDYDTAAQRELVEELGVKLDKPLIKLFKLPADTKTGNEFIWVYLGFSNGPFLLNPIEISEGCFYSHSWIDLKLATEPQSFSNAFIEIWKFFRNKKVSSYDQAHKL